MSKIKIETRVVSGTEEGKYGWAYMISKGRRCYKDSGVFDDTVSSIEAEILVFRKMCVYLHDNIQFSEDTKISIFSECRELIRLMRNGTLSEIDDVTNDKVAEALKELLVFRETKAKCVYKFISLDRKDQLDQSLTLLAQKALKN